MRISLPANIVRQAATNSLASIKASRDAVWEAAVLNCMKEHSFLGFKWRKTRAEAEKALRSDGGFMCTHVEIYHFLYGAQEMRLEALQQATDISDTVILEDDDVRAVRDELVTLKRNSAPVALQNISF